METNEINIDTCIKHQIKLVIENKIFYSEKTFDSKEDSDNYMKFLSNNKNCLWYSIPVLCPKQTLNLSDLITGKFQNDNPLENISFKSFVEKEFEK